MKVIFEMDDEVEVGKPVRMERVGELVECKDCKHGHKYEFCVKCENAGNPGMFATYHRFDWYCADGKKKDE